jgi:hypothetical protein
MLLKHFPIYLSYGVLVWQLGRFVTKCENLPDFEGSPNIGGLLANPADRWPHRIGHITFFRDYPYFLPCAVAAFVAMLCFLLTLVGLKEVSNSPYIQKHRLKHACRPYLPLFKRSHLQITSNRFKLTAE